MSDEYFKLPSELSDVNLRVYMSKAFGLCGCSEMEAVYDTVIRLLRWHAVPIEDRPSYNELYPESGIFYILAGWMDSPLGLSEHGTAIRCPWLTGDGHRLLSALEKTTAEKIESATGEAYDGCEYV